MTAAPLTYLPPPPNPPSVAAVNVSPEMAQQWLDRNTNNRRIRRTLVASYASDMRAGNWQLTGDAIRFAADGTLLDGQHRLLAVVDAKVTIPLFVIRGLSRDAQAVMDIGSKRTAGDALRLRGAEGDVKERAAIARSLLMIATGQKPTVAAVVQFAEENSVALADAAQVSKAISAAGVRGGNVWGCAYYELHRLDPMAADNFFNRIVDGADLAKGSPILLLRNRFVLGMPATARDASSLRHNLAWIYRAWNQWRDGREMQRLFVKAGELPAVPR